ncbi:hypothetical protein Megpolyxen_01108 [Candidatus Megaera polyxenophila]|nr:hypothetical protein Megpolyxen_01108 [Candidatus Megaera polyxenophila]
MLQNKENYNQYNIVAAPFFPNYTAMAGLGNLVAGIWEAIKPKQKCTSKKSECTGENSSSLNVADIKTLVPIAVLVNSENHDLAIPLLGHDDQESY